MIEREKTWKIMFPVVIVLIAIWAISEQPKADVYDEPCSCECPSWPKY